MVFQRKRTKIAAALGGLSLFALVIIWVQREPIAQNLIDRTLADSGVQGRYDITAIGTRRQRLENISLGDPANPDLTAKWAEIDVGPSLSGLKVRAVRAGGVRVRGQWADNHLTMGVVDRLLPKPTDEPFTLPDIEVSLTDARMSLGAPWGKTGLVLNGKGNLAHSFLGQLAVASPTLRVGNVTGDRVMGLFQIGTVNRRITFEGPVKLASLAVSGTKIVNVVAAVKGGGDEQARSVYLDWDASGHPVQLPVGAAQVLRVNGSVKRDQSRTTQGDGAIWIDGLRPSVQEAHRLASTIPTAAGTPAQPVFDQIRRALAALQQGSTLKTAFTFEQSPSATRLAITPGEATSRSGLRLTGSGPGLSLGRGGVNPQFQAEYKIAGGGFPSGSVTLGHNHNIWQGQAIFSPYQAGSARLTLAPARFHYDRTGLSLTSVVTMDGPLGTGRLTGLRIPLAIRPGHRPLAGCTPTSFQSLDIAGLHLSPARLITCLSSKDARIASPRLSGRLGSSPISIAASGARIGLSKGDFAIDGLAVRLGGKARLSVMDVGILSGTLQTGGAKGQFTGASGQIGNVPLLLSDGTGQWALQNAALTIGGGIQIADAAIESRFSPLISDDFALRLVDNRIKATATVREPKSHIAISNISIAHDLDSGAGNAVLDVPGIRFGRTLQPEALTNITLGVIANVEGSISGRGQINWIEDGVTSSGVFRTTGMNLAAAFGPVTGLTGEIRLSDLLALETAPGQLVSIGSINPGIAVLDGQIAYQLLPGLKARIEGGRWPLAGGTLILDPTTLDLSEAAERRLTFRVEGMDAARFIAQFDFDNIAATGIFDGVLPMVFDRNGGRIESGRLVARAGGGTLAYVGEVSNENLGTMGSFAFDALKAIKYKRLSIDLAGPLDGDIVTRISFAGVNQAPIKGPRTKLPIKIIGLTNIPFIFNVTITAPFRQLFDMTRTFSDPSLLLERMEPRLQRLQREPNPDKPVQPQESEPMR